MKQDLKLEHCKKIAGLSLINMFGQEWIKENSSNLCSMISDEGTVVRVTFCLASILPTEDELLSEKDINYQPDGSISFIVNKKDDTCKVFRNLMP